MWHIGAVRTLARVNPVYSFTGRRTMATQIWNLDHIDRNAAASFKPLLPPEDFNFAFDVLDSRAQHADKTALLAIESDGFNHRNVSYSDLSTKSAQFANALERLGLQRGDSAVVIMERVPDWYVAIFGCMKIGVVTAPGTTLLTSRDIAYRVNKLGAKAIIVTTAHCHKVDEALGSCPTLEHRIAVDGGDWLGAQLSEGWQDLGQMCNAEPEEHHRTRFSPEDPMMVYFTSGTTAPPKVVPRDMGYAYSHATTGLFWMDLQKDDIHWSLTDTGWAKAAWGMLFPQFLLGVTTVLFNPSGFEPAQHLQLIDRYNVTTFCAPPTAYRAFAQLDLPSYGLSSLRRCMGAGEPLNPEVIRYWESCTNTVIADGYGQTETVNVVGNFPSLETRHGSMGKPVPGFDVDIISEDAEREPVGNIGHIGIRCAEDEPWPPGLFRGYLQTDGTVDSTPFRGGWYFTGDMGHMDEDGYIWFEGRADDLITSSGYRISPFEVESALLEHQAVAESAVVAQPDELRGEVVKAYVILAAGFDANMPGLTKEIQNFCKELTAPYKYPRVIEFVSELPKTISGKIRRVELRQQDDSK